jgi:iron complex outermembrane receptor protein
MRTSKPHLQRDLLWLALLAALPATAFAAGQQAAAAAPVKALPAVTVSAIRLGVPSFDVPASVDLVEADAGKGGKPGVNLSEQLTGVPGVLARDRQNYAQDEQISVRGFGSRSTFGVRGVRLYADGIPATMPDGQGEVSHFSLEAADRIEVLRGPFSALYGNSSGGVVQIWSADGTSPAQNSVGIDAGSHDTYRAGASSRGKLGEAVDYNIAASHFQTGGYREHSRAQRESGNAKFNIQLAPATRLTVVANTLALPNAQDPLGLTKQQYDQDPRQAGSGAVPFNTRKSVHQTQGGAVLAQDLGAHDELRLMGYYGERTVYQVLSIPVASQRSPLNSGGVVDLDSDYGGADLRWTHRGELAGGPYELAVGTSYDDENQSRFGYENFIGAATGVKGAVRRNESDRVYNADQYAQLYWHFAEDWSLLAGMRHSAVRFRSRDRYVTASNPDDSGRTAFGATTPVAGLQYRPSEALRLYASYGEGFETPTFAELGYRADGGAGLAFDLRPARSRNRELGAKWRPQPGVEIDAAVFRADTRDELAVATNSGGRSTYQNVGHTRREGYELSADAELWRGWHLRAGFTHLLASFRSDFLTCTGTPCTLTPVHAGTPLPGVPRNYGSLRLGHDAGQGWSGGLELNGVGKVTANDVGTASAAGYLLTGVDAGYGFALAAREVLHLSLRVDNLFDRKYVGSVIVNEGNGRYYEPGPGRSYMLGARLDF